MKLNIFSVFSVLLILTASCAHIETQKSDKVDCRSAGSIFAIAYQGDVSQLKARQFSKQEINQPVKGKECHGWTPIIIASAEGHSAREGPFTGCREVC